MKHKTRCNFHNAKTLPTLVILTQKHRHAIIRSSVFGRVKSSSGESEIFPFHRRIKKSPKTGWKRECSLLSIVSQVLPVIERFAKFRIIGEVFQPNPSFNPSGPYLADIYVIIFHKITTLVIKLVTTLVIILKSASNSVFYLFILLRFFFLTVCAKKVNVSLWQ